jgi:hypothetical protein
LEEIGVKILTKLWSFIENSRLKISNNCRKYDSARVLGNFYPICGGFLFKDLMLLKMLFGSFKDEINRTKLSFYPF